MTTEQRRAILSMQSKPFLRRHVRLQHDPVRSAWAVLSPERVFWPNEVSLDILTLCDGNNTVETIVKRLADQYDAPTEEIVGDVETFLQEWSDRLLVAS